MPDGLIFLALAVGVPLAAIGHWLYMERRNRAARKAISRRREASRTVERLFR